MPRSSPFCRFLSSLSSAGNLNLHIRSKAVASTLRSIYNEHNPDRIVTLLHQSFTTPGLIRAVHPVYVAAFRRLIAAGSSSAISDFLETQKKRSSAKRRESFLSGIISLYGKAGMPQHASDTFRQLPFLGCPRTAMSFRALLCALVDSGEARSAAAQIESVASEYPNIVPGEVCYNVVIHGLMGIGDVEKALSVLELMRSRGLEPNLVTNNTLLNGFYQNGRFDLAEKVWTSMGEKTIMSFNARLRGLVREGRTAAAVNLFHELESSEGLKPDGYSFTALIMGHCKDGNLDEAKKVFDEMRRNRCQPNRLTFEALVPKLCEACEMDMALKLCEESLLRNLRLATDVMQGVVDGLARNSRAEDAKKLVELGWSKCYDEKTLRMPLN